MVLCDPRTVLRPGAPRLLSSWRSWSLGRAWGWSGAAALLWLGVSPTVKSPSGTLEPVFVVRVLSGGTPTVAHKPLPWACLCARASPGASPVPTLSVTHLVTLHKNLHLSEFQKKNPGVGFHFLPQGIFLTQESDPRSLVPPALAGRFFTTVPYGKLRVLVYLFFSVDVDCSEDNELQGSKIDCKAE